MREAEVVGIITRTKNRTVLLKRAIESVLDQSYTDWRMVIVNDGGKNAPVEELMAFYSARAAGRICVIHNVRSLGMEGASAVGFEHVEGDLLIVHDDDDSWAPEFLSTAVSTLQDVRQNFPAIAGVTTYSNRVWETIQGNLIHIDLVEPYNGWVPPGLLNLDQILAGNILPPISFLFRREAFNRLDRIYERIPYLGDWDFLIRFLMQHDVIMIPQYLAFYHWRASAGGAEFGNSVIAELERHHFYRQLLLNEWLRSDLVAGRFGIGTYANLRSHLETLIQQDKS